MNDVYVSSCAVDGGVAHLRLDGEKITFCDMLSCPQPMYVCRDNDAFYVLLRSVPEFSGQSAVLKARRRSDGSLEALPGLLPTGGDVGCHLCARGDDVYAANYIGGNLSLCGRKTVSGSADSHMHFAGFSPDEKYVLSCDLGLDCVTVYNRQLEEVSRAFVPKGHGARHLAWAPDGRTVYCVNELGSSVTAFEYSDGRLRALETVSALPQGCNEKNASAAIRLAGNRLYVSNRGHDSISVFDIEKVSPHLLYEFKTGGGQPRDFNIYGDVIVCANQMSDSVTVLNLSGRQTCRIGIDSPISVL